ncbi:MAG: polyisoprenoid-binding protein [Candidatus Omnitrophica bacterium]|nr:polyisoprenoid-binding protein [Candidatus Omnitrophota bacterium]
MKSRVVYPGFILSMVLGAVVGFAAAATQAQAAVAYEVDKVHSTVGFTISHLMVSKVTGTFNDYEGKVQFNPNDLATAKFDFTIQVQSIDTRNGDRDKHLKSAEFFDAITYPQIVFKTKKVQLKSGNEYLVTGDLTMKDVTKEVELPVTVSGPVPNPMGGGAVLGIESHFTLNRQDYGVSWNKVIDNGGLMIGNDVQASVLIEAHAK